MCSIESRVVREYTFMNGNMVVLGVENNLLLSLCISKACSQVSCIIVDALLRIRVVLSVVQ